MEIRYLVMFAVPIIECIVLIIIALYLRNKERTIQETAIARVNGEVVRYSLSNARAPIVKYRVGAEDYEKALRYSYVSASSSFKFLSKPELKDDILDTKLRIKGGSTRSAWGIMQENFPIGSNLSVYFNPENPKIAYVERYAKSYASPVLLFAGIAVALVLVLVFSLLILTGSL